MISRRSLLKVAPVAVVLPFIHKPLGPKVGAAGLPYMEEGVYIRETDAIADSLYHRFVVVYTTRIQDTQKYFLNHVRIHKDASKEHIRSYLRKEMRDVYILGKEIGIDEAVSALQW